VPSRAAARLAWTLCAACVTLASLGLVYGAFDYDSPAAFITKGWVPNTIVAISFPVVGALIAAHRPRNPLGWIFCAVGLFQALPIVGAGYGVYALRTAPGTMPGGSLAVWLGQWAWAPSVGLLFTFLPLLFPDGRLPSPRWGPLAWLSAVAITLMSGIYAILLWPHRGPALIEYDPEQLLGARRALVLNATFPLVVVCALACLAALAVRFRRAREIERQQLKWLLFAGVVTVAIIVLAESWPGGLLLAVPLLPSIPVAVGIAILRYRLYDIDRIISRTLSYVLLSAILGLAYAGAVLLLGQLFGGVTNQPPSWAVAGATLAVAALFQPARRRIQQAVDRRFNRRRYDAATTIQAFIARLRDEIDLDTLSAELRAVVDQTMEPTTASLWLRPTTSLPQDVSDSVAHRPAARPDPLRSGRRSMYGNRARQHAPTMPQGGGEDAESQGR
jgi:hypothetical protein